MMAEAAAPCPRTQVKRLALGAALLALAVTAAVAGPWRGHGDNSAGWRWMSPAERVEHQRRLRATRSLAECKAYLAEHHERLRQRARQAGQELGPQREDDACDRLWRTRTP